MTIRNFLLALAALFLLMAQPAFAAQQMLCSPENTSGAQNRRVTVTSSTASPQPTYQLNGQGCALVAQADIGFFLSQGYTPGPSFGSVIFTTGVATSTTDFVVGNIPAGAYIREMIWSNAVAAAVTGGVDVGTTANGTDVVSAQAVGSAALTFTGDVALLKRVFSATAPTPIHIAAHTAWNSTNVTLTIVYAYY